MNNELQIEIDKLQYLTIGVQGENNANQIVIDMTSWAEEFPNVSYHILYKPYNEISAVPMVTTYNAATHILRWHVTISATLKAGVGYAEVRAIDPETSLVKKSKIIPTSVENSVTGVDGGLIPEPYEDWVNSVLIAGAKADEAMNAAEAAAQNANEAAEDAASSKSTAENLVYSFENARATATSLLPGTNPTAHVHIYDDETPTLFEFGIPRGDKGEKGDPFRIVKTYSSYAEMMADVHGTDVYIGDYVAISGPAESTDHNGEVYEKTVGGWQYKCDITYVVGQVTAEVKQVTYTDGGTSHTVNALHIVTDDTPLDEIMEAIEDKGEETIESIPSDYTALSNSVVDLKSALSNMGETFPTMPQHFTSGNITASGGSTDSNKWIRNGAGTTHLFKIQRGDFYIVSDEYAGKVMISDTGNLSSAHVIAQATPASGVRSGILAIPDEYEGYYAAIALQKIGHENDDISSDIATIGNYVKYYRPALVNKVPDTTLEQEGYPADAKAVGDALSGVEEEAADIIQNFMALKNGNVSSLQDGQNLDELLTPGNYKVTSSASAETMSDYLPYTNAGGRFIVAHAFNENRHFQAYITAQSAVKVFIRYYNGTSWGDWRQLANKDELNAVSDDLSALRTDVNNTDEYLMDIIQQGENQINLIYTSGNITDSGSATSGSLSRIRTATNSILTPTVKHGDYVWVDSAYEVRIGIYVTPKYITSYDNFVGFVVPNKAFKNGWIAIPDTYIGKYIGICVRKIGYEDSDISGDIPIIQEKVKYIRAGISRGYTDGERPVYVAFGASTTAGAIHTADGIIYTNKNFPDYISSVLGLETHNLAVGNTGFLSRFDDDNNFMDLIYKNGNLLSRAKLVTIMFGYGNDRVPGAQNQEVFRIGNYDDYYPYDEEGYHPSGDSTGIVTMIEKGATLMGCLNWCIRWINLHYPFAQLIIIFGSPSACDEREVTMTAQTEDVGIAPYKLTFANPYDFSEDVPEQDIDNAHYTANYGGWRINNEINKLKKALNIPVINLFSDGSAFDWYSTYAKDPNNSTKYALFSTVPISEKYPIGWNPHPNEAGYLYYARFIAGKVISLFKH